MEQAPSNLTEIPRICVLMPVYNAGRTLGTAIESILGQTFADLELLIVDDGSVDASPQIAADYAQKDRRIRIHCLPENRGIVAALNTGMELAEAPLIARMDADDVSFPERLAAQCEYMELHPNVGVVGTVVEFGGDREKHAGYARYVDWTNSLIDPDAISLHRFIESPYAHPSVMFRRELVEAYGGYRDGAFPEDYELWLRWLACGVRMGKVNRALVRWSDPPERLSRTDDRYSFRAFYRCKAEYLARWLTKNNPHHPHIIQWGAGRETRKRSEVLTEYGVEITHYVDIDPRKIGQIIHGRPVLGEDVLPVPGECFVVSYVGNVGAREDIRHRLVSRGYIEGRHFIMGA